MAGTSEGGKKAAAHRSEESLRKSGEAGANALNSDPEKKSEASRKAAQTRGHDEMAKMGREGGKASGGHKSQGE
jgi:general stress protein YciG